MKIYSNRILKRFFAHLTTRVPTWLRKDIQHGFQDQKSLPLIAEEKSAQLKNRAEKGCKESEDFLSKLHEFRDPANNTLFTDNTPKDPREIRWLSLITSWIINPKWPFLASSRIKRDLSIFKEIAPHSDGSATGVKIAITTIYGVASEGLATTGFISVDDINSRLSEASREILKQHMFHYLSEEPIGFINKSSFKMPILYYEDDGSLNINLFMGSGKFLVYDEDKSSYSEDQIDLAIKGLYAIIYDLKKEGKTTEVNIKTNQSLTVKNKRGPHYVTLAEPADEERDTLVISFEDPRTSPKITTAKPFQPAIETAYLRNQI